MKNILLVLTAILVIGCSANLSPEPDPADAFVGEYTTVDNYYVRWGGDNKFKFRK